MPETKAPLMAGVFTDIPVRIHDYGGGKFMFMNASNTGCWSDPEHRALLYSLDDVKKVAMAHGYEIEDLQVRRRDDKDDTARIAAREAARLADATFGAGVDTLLGADTLKGAEAFPPGAYAEPTGNEDDMLKGKPDAPTAKNTLTMNSPPMGNEAPLTPAQTKAQEKAAKEAEKAAAKDATDAEARTAAEAKAAAEAARGRR